MVAIPELAIETLVGVPSGSVTVYVKSKVRFVGVGIAVVDDKVIDGAVFINVTLYQPEPFDIYNELVDVVYKACTACPKTFPTRNDYEQMTKYLSVMKTGKFRTYDLELRNCSCGSTLATECEKV